MIHSLGYIHRDLKPENMIFQFVTFLFNAGNRQDMRLRMGCRLRFQLNEKIILRYTTILASWNDQKRALRPVSRHLVDRHLNLRAYCWQDSLQHLVRVWPSANRRQGDHLPDRLRRHEFGLNRFHKEVSEQGPYQKNETGSIDQSSLFENCLNWRILQRWCLWWYWKAVPMKDVTSRGFKFNNLIYELFIFASFYSSLKNGL